MVELTSTSRYEIDYCVVCFQGYVEIWEYIWYKLTEDTLVVVLTINCEARFYLALVVTNMSTLSGMVDYQIHVHQLKCFTSEHWILMHEIGYMKKKKTLWALYRWNISRVFDQLQSTRFRIRYGPIFNRNFAQFHFDRCLYTRVFVS